MMLTFKRLTIKNFGPFKGRQIIEFPNEGIVIIYGENMRGKTSLLNAIRYVLFGKVLGRSSQEQSLHLMTNWEEMANGNFGFTVILDFTDNGHEYQLTRTLAPAKGILLPICDDDYIQHCFLNKDDVVLGPQDMAIELSQIMPEQVSRFFLFDGELLQEYEELLRQESEMGEKITKAIERILGLPILTNARIDINDLHRKAQKQSWLEAQKDQKTRELGNIMEDLTRQIQDHESEMNRLISEKEKLIEEKARLDEELRSYERIKAWLDELDALKDEVKGKEGQIEEKREQLKSMMAISWRSILNHRVKEIHQSLENRREIIQKHVNEKALLSTLQQALILDKCPICSQGTTEYVKSIIEERISHIQDGDEKFDSKELDQIIYSIKILQAFSAKDVTLLVTELSKDLDKLNIELSTKKDSIKDIEKQTQNYDQSKVRALYGDHTKVIKKIGSLEEGISGEEKLIKSISENINELEKKLQQASGSSSSIERRKSDLYANLFKLLDASVGNYRNNLKTKVQQEATRIFLQLTSEPDYASLEINENYGLRIVHKDGSTIPIRSAGAEHIVALSLMGSLHKNAPLSGPIVMDSPFGRLDDTHTSKVVKALPEMASQVILLVYKSELLPSLARTTLNGNLKAEYKLVRQTARHTTIEKNIEE